MKSKTVLFARKVIAIFFWDSQLVIKTAFLQKDQNVKRLHYAELLGRTHPDCRKRGLVWQMEIVIIHYDSALPHLSTFMTKLLHWGYGLLLQPTISPHLARASFLIPTWKMALPKQKFYLNEEVIALTEAYFYSPPEFKFIKLVKYFETSLGPVYEAKGKLY